MKKTRAFEPHEGQVTLKHQFDELWQKLDETGPIDLETENGASFFVVSGITTRGKHEGKKVIKFKKDTSEYARSYECCWGKYYNCYGTRHGMYCKILDEHFKS